MYCVHQTDKKLEEKIFLLQCSKDEFVQNMIKAVGTETYNAKVLTGISFNDIRINSCFSDGYYFLINKNQYQLVAKHKQIKRGILIDSVWFLTDLLFTWKIFPLETNSRSTIKIEEFKLNHISESCSCILRGSNSAGSRIIVSDLLDELEIDPTNIIIFSSDEENKLFYSIRYPTSNIYFEYDHNIILNYLKERNLGTRSCLILDIISSITRFGTSGEDHINFDFFKELLDKEDQLTIILIVDNITNTNSGIYDYIFVLDDHDEINLNLIWSKFFSSLLTFDIFCQKFRVIIHDCGSLVINSSEPKSFLYYNFKKDMVEQMSES